MTRLTAWWRARVCLRHHRMVEAAWRDGTHPEVEAGCPCGGGCHESAYACSVACAGHGGET